jgi:hypothetical protein
MTMYGVVVQLLNFYVKTIRSQEKRAPYTTCRNRWSCFSYVRLLAITYYKIKGLGGGEVKVLAKNSDDFQEKSDEYRTGQNRKKIRQKSGKNRMKKIEKIGKKLEENRKKIG